jgi:hypothetical protein
LHKGAITINKVNKKVTLPAFRLLKELGVECEVVTGMATNEAGNLYITIDITQ